MFVEVVGEEGDKGVNGDHEEHTNDTGGLSVLTETFRGILDLLPLLIWLEIVCRVSPDQVPRHQDCNHTKDSREDETEIVEGVVLPYRYFVNCGTG